MKKKRRKTNIQLFFLLLLKLREFNRKTEATLERKKKNFRSEEFKIRLLPSGGSVDGGPRETKRRRRRRRRR